MSEPAVVITDLHKSFGSVQVLRGVDLSVARGEVVCIIGPSGSGKSTLLRCVNLLETPTARSTRRAARSGWCSSRSTCSAT